VKPYSPPIGADQAKVGDFIHSTGLQDSVPTALKPATLLIRPGLQGNAAVSIFISAAAGFNTRLEGEALTMIT
jgi:hypothetical protein